MKTPIKTSTDFLFTDRALLWLVLSSVILLFFVNALLVVSHTNPILQDSPWRYIIHQMDLDAEGNFATWCSSMLLLINAFYAYRLAREWNATDQYIALTYLLLAAGFVFLSIDDFIGIHEFLERTITPLFRSRVTLGRPLDTGPSPFYGLALASIFIVFVIGASWWEAIQRKNLPILIGCVVCVVLVALAEVVYVRSGCIDRVCFRVEVLVEEGSELLAVLLFLTFQSREVTQ